MLYAYIGVALLLGLLIGFVSLSVMWLSKRVSADIKSKTVELISSYDALLEKRSRELSDLEELLLSKAAAAAAPVSSTKENTATAEFSDFAVLNIVERIGNASYLDSQTGGVYRSIRSSFDAKPEEVLKKLLPSAQFVSGAASRLLSSLPFDTVYSLSTLSEADQLSILRESLDEEGLKLLENHQNRHSHFRAIDFYDDLKAAAEMEPQPPKLYVSPVYSGGCPEGVELIVDPDICEGFQIEVDNILYDYCIKERELN